MTAITDFETLGKADPLFAELERIVKDNNWLWNAEAERFLLENAAKIE